MLRGMSICVFFLWTACLMCLSLAVMTKTNGQPVFRRPVSRPARVRAFNLRIAGLADVNRMKYELTMLAVSA